MSPRTLVLLRHAKSAWPDGVADIERPLGGRGRRDAAAVGRWLAEHVAAIDLVLCSPAVRTRHTWALAAEQFEHDPKASAPGRRAAAEVRFESDIYLATPQSLLSLVRSAPDSVATLVIVGHNPGTQDLALRLAGSGDSNSMARMESKFPTAALAVLELHGSWRDVDKGQAVLVDFAAPRG